MLAPAVIALTSPRAALAIVGAVLPLLMLAKRAALTRLDEPLVLPVQRFVLETSDEPVHAL